MFEQNLTASPLKEAIVETTLEEISAEINLVDNPTFQKSKDEVIEVKTIPEDSFNSNICCPAIEEVINEKLRREAPIPVDKIQASFKNRLIPYFLYFLDYST